MALSPMITSKALGAMPEFVLEVAGQKRLSQALDAAELPFHFVEEREGYIPERCLAAFIHEAARSAGQQNIGLVWSPFLTVADYGTWGQYVLSAPTLGHALQRASSVMPLHSSADRAWLETVNDASRYCYQFGLRSHRAYPDVGFSAIGVFLSIFRAYLGQNWRPEAVLLDFSKVPGFAAVEDTYHCPAIWNAPRLGVQFKTSCLDQTATQAVASSFPVTVADIARERLGGPPETVRGQVASVIRLQLHTNEISIDTTARVLDTGVRTLQRQLEVEGVKFRQIANEVLTVRAKELLLHTNLSISAIGSSLGYDAANNFSRAFKNATGATPSEFRAEHLT